MKVLKYFESFTEEQLKKLEIEHKTYLKKIKKETIKYPEEVQIILNNMKNYDISNFSFNNKSYDFCIKPDDKFIYYINELNKYITEKILLNITFNFSYDVENLNLIDFKKGIPNILQSNSFGYKLYCFVLDKIKFITSDFRASDKAIHLWRHLIKDDKFYTFTSTKITGALLKNQTNNEIKIILDKIKNYNSNIVKFDFNELIFDEELEEKIKEIYGSLDIYTQRN